MLQNNRIDRLDALILLSCESCIDEEVNEFYDQKIEHTMSERANRRILRMIRRYDRARKFAPYKRPLLIAAFAVMLAITLSFVACMSIPKVRKAIWKAITEWHDDYISVKFVPNDDEGSTTGTAKETNPTTEHGTDEPDKTSTTTDKPNDQPVVHVDPPETIAEINVPTYIPEGYTVEKTLLTTMYLEVYYFNSSFKYSFYQLVFSAFDSIDMDSQYINEHEYIINGINFRILEYDDNMYNIVWNDNKYAYYISGTFEDTTVLNDVLKSVSKL